MRGKREKEGKRYPPLPPGWRWETHDSFPSSSASSTGDQCVSLAQVILLQRGGMFIPHLEHPCGWCREDFWELKFELNYEDEFTTRVKEERKVR